LRGAPGWRLENYSGRQVDKWQHYFPIYDRHFYRFEPTRVLEIGVDHGGSLQIWKQYFPTAEIVGLDINPACKAYEEDRISIVIGDQTDTKLLNSLGEFDIVIDDGSHIREHQSASFTALWPRTKSVYLIEDCHGMYPGLVTTDTTPLRYEYPWVLVLERPKRIIVGEPSRELRPDELLARESANGKR
jgi:cephalosporin hydroxylase